MKGYGEVRRRMFAHLERLLAATLAAAERHDIPAATQLARDYRALVLSGPEGEVRAEALTAPR